MEDIIYEYHAEWPILRWQDFRAKNDHPEGEVVVVGPHIEQGIPLQTTFLLYCRSSNRSFA